MDNPCYNKATKTGCPRRAPGCAVNCPEWAEYTKERESVYDARKKTLAHERDFGAISHKRVVQNAKRRLYNRSRPRGNHI